MVYRVFLKSDVNSIDFASIQLNWTQFTVTNLL